MDSVAPATSVAGSSGAGKGGAQTGVIDDDVMEVSVLNSIAQWKPRNAEREKIPIVKEDFDKMLRQEATGPSTQKAIMDPLHEPLRRLQQNDATLTQLSLSGKW